MAPRLTHNEIEELLGAYALDAVDPDEAEVIEAHLVECPQCRAEVAEHRETASMLAFSGETAPDAIWSRIAEDLEDAPPPFELTPPTPLRRPGASRPSGWLLGAAAAVVAIVVGLGAMVVQQDQRLDDLDAVSDQQGIDQAAAAAAVHPGAEMVQLLASDGTKAGNAILLPDGSGYLVDTDLPALDDDLTYQLWGQQGEDMISLGLLGEDRHVTAFSAGEGVSAIAITKEPAGGVNTPTSEPLAIGTVS